MKIRYKILWGAGVVLVAGIGTLMMMTAYDSPCPAVSSSTSASNAMRALTSPCYGIQNLRLTRVDKPTPGEGQVLIRIRASSVNPAEWYGINGQPYLVRLMAGIGKPKDTSAGFDMAGVVEAVGAGVTRFKPGDEVFGGVNGALAEYGIAHQDRGIALKPAGMSFEEAAAIPIAGITALQGLRDNGMIKAGQKVLINGASGGVGTYAVQIAKALGAEVTGVCSTRNVEMVRALGADHVVDYTKQDFTQSEERYDLILDNVGNHGYFALARVTKTDGYIVSVGGEKSNPWLGPITRVIVKRPVAGLFLDQHLPFYIARVKRVDLEFLAALVDQGKLRTVIDRRYPLEDTSKALAYLGSGHARGKIIIDID